MSPIEKKCLCLAAKGVSVENIAARLQLDRTAIRAHLDAARRRLGAGSLLAAIAKALRSGIITIEPSERTLPR